MKKTDTTTEVDIEETGASTFEDGVFTVIGFWFSLTNLSEKIIEPTLTWNLHITGYEDDNKDRLSLTNVPDDPLNENLDKAIPKRKTINCCIAYIISDTTDLMALVGAELPCKPTMGSMTVDLLGV